jgi:hypothetical protein
MKTMRLSNMLGKILPLINLPNSAIVRETTPFKLSSILPLPLIYREQSITSTTYLAYLNKFLRMFTLYSCRLLIITVKKNKTLTMNMTEKQP